MHYCDTFYKSLSVGHGNSSLFNIINNSVYFRLASVEKNLQKGEVLFLFQRDICRHVFLWSMNATMKAMNENNPRVCQPINGERKHNTPHSRAPLIHESESHHL